jgi:hypothetical protein
MLPVQPRLLAPAGACILFTWSLSATAFARPTDDEGDRPESADDDDDDDDGDYDEEDEDRFDDGFHVYLSPGGINVPYGGREAIDYSDSFDPGFQWGLGIGYFARSDSPFALHIGPFFEHAVVNAENRDLGDDDGEHLFRGGLELEPGVVLGERFFLGLPLRAGYAADVLNVDDDVDVQHGAHFGVAVGLDLALWRGFYVGTALGTDLHFFRSGEDYDAYTFAWRARVGYRF